MHEKLRRYDLSRYGAVEKEGFTQALKLSRVPLGAQRVGDLFNDLDVRGLGRVQSDSFRLSFFALQ